MSLKYLFSIKCSKTFEPQEFKGRNGTRRRARGYQSEASATTHSMLRQYCDSGFRAKGKMEGKKRTFRCSTSE